MGGLFSDDWGGQAEAAALEAGLTELGWKLGDNIKLRRPAPGGAPSSANTQTEVALRANCGPDVQRLCRVISWENGDVIKCLNSHRMELSPICVAYFNAQKGAPKATSPNR
jgi:hypothetical protein